MTSQTRKQIIKIHILPNIPRSKGNKTVKFGQLIEHNMRNIFLEKIYTKCGEASFRPLCEKSKLGVILDQQIEVLWRLFLLYVKVKVYQNILKLRYWQLDFTSYKAFVENKKKSGTSLLISFSAWSFKKNVTFYAINWPNSITWLPLFLEILGNMYSVIVSKSVAP